MKMNYIQLTVTKPYFVDIIKNYNIETFIFDENSIRIHFLDVNDLTDKDIDFIKSDGLNIYFADDNWVRIW
jgi:hypothetical protein